MADVSLNRSQEDSITIRIDQPDEAVAQYTARVTSPGGETYHFFTLHPEWTETNLRQVLNNFRVGVSSDRLAPMRGKATDNFTPQIFGKQLFQTIFAGKVEELYRNSLSLMQTRGGNLPVRLDVQPKSLARLSWELLFDPLETTEAGYLCFGQETPIVRFFDKAARPPTYDPPLRLLLVSANPSETATLNLQTEFGVVTKALAALVQADKAKIDYLFGANIDDLSERIRNFKPHIVHFMGHGNLTLSH